ncbi:MULTISPECIES: MerR family transcriptional regulator [unclassified Mesobacillus]|uniref:MerR family transcriptional regulator n=1 Tax=unclassified Mesobacillus TaxID=2675270 RepID=UPI00203FF322|nr:MULTISPECIES: MerR family transcriptional regulator [unclassified Mesobacillus]MCM3122228.1 MerR family transcriptional regulator [Mesobacillus sp. MER 33]MCM3232192.1 MerR family transcriptional regulator [Mesobacillus sp. MER 48]
MGNSTGKYNIKAAANMLGIQPGTLRAWERRYQMIAPARNESGHRLYTEEHLKILRWLISKVNQGFTISQAVSLLENTEPLMGPSERPKKDKQDEFREEILTALLGFNSSKAHELINQAFSIFTIDKTVIDLLGPILIKVGDLWEEGSITTAHEHFASSFLRSRVEGLSSSFPHSSFLPKVIAVCGPGERHELGLLIYTMYLRRKGFEVIFLGTSLAENDIEAVLDKVKPRFLFLSCTLEENREATLELAGTIKKNYPGLHIGLGGIAIDSMPEGLQKEHQERIVGITRAEWEKWLKKRIDSLK